MNFPQITVHMEVEFDSAGLEPVPWWAPFAWYRVYQEKAHWQRVLRVGMLGFHVGLSLCFYSEEMRAGAACGEDLSGSTAEQHAIEALPPKERAALALSRDGKGYEEIGQALRISPRQARRLIERALENVLKVIQ